MAVGFGQFGLLFLAMDGMISPGLASLVIQMQVFFTVGFSMARSGERLKPHQLAAFALALTGMGVIAAHNGPQNGHGATATGLVLVLLSAASWAVSNQAAREAIHADPQLNILAYVVWASLFALPPLYLLSLWREGWPAMIAGISHAGAATWAVVLWQSLGNTMFGYGCWAWLLARYPAIGDEWPGSESAMARQAQTGAQRPAGPGLMPMVLGGMAAGSRKGWLVLVCGGGGGGGGASGLRIILPSA